MAVIDVRGIGKHYRQRGRGFVHVLRSVDLRIEEGTVLGVLGPNGAGKTTLVKILAGLLRPDTGKGTVLGYDLLRRHDDIRARVSLVAPTADVGLDNNLTVRQNLAFWAPIYGLRGGQAERRIDELLERLDLIEKADFWPMHISAGQRQRLALARSLLAHNRLVFLDEPTNKLDLEGVRSVRDMIADLNVNHGVTIVLTTHVMEEAEELCREIALLRAGELIAHRETRDLMRSLGLTRPLTVVLRGMDALDGGATAQLEALPGVTAVSPMRQESGRVSLTLHSLDLRTTTPALLSWVRHQGLAVITMRAQPITLGDVFLTLTGSGVEENDDAG
jgi:ABC-2 type transport system ATP-binding protein